ncbi:hypothetical protein N7462_008552 [Penicillium macrosclerotiorum]|uniref:uncharacterized protein n=1 Tax=Penicillium macrosclerotiorum TaxID=303699 RepID=UPI002549918C|nr:uncharacterized protein N7462_008552 [Penicillium macrosclerotiorum]KAJ5675655.1 hypothetical protein N7462_008552 [Penicillium macrosclerotiorum]
MHHDGVGTGAYRDPIRTAGEDFENPPPPPLKSSKRRLPFVRVLLVLLIASRSLASPDPCHILATALGQDLFPSSSSLSPIGTLALFGLGLNVTGWREPRCARGRF